MPSGNQSILIVDDNEADVRIFRSLVEDAGYTASSTLSGKEGLRSIREGKFELLVLDLSIPEMDGFEILRAICNQAPKPKVIVVSGHAHLLGMAMKAGADLALDKLVAPDVFVTAVRKLI
jgi:two-component system repressor protein LuxO